jgi:DNA-binding GntR family transcriptional regulator
MYDRRVSRSVAQAINATVRQRATRELRDRILAGTLPAGTRIDLDALSAEFGISRTPVREALLELSFQGLVEVAPRSGVTVLGVSPDTTVDNFSILATLSGKAAGWAADRITADELAALDASARVLTSAAPGEDVIEANWRFHRVINQASRSPHLLSLLRQAVRLIPSNYLAVMPVGDNDEHEQLLAAMHARDAVTARDIAEAHVLSAGQSLADWLAQRHPAAAAGQ